MNLTKAHLLEFDRLIQLLESPGFTSLRFELLDRPATLLATLRGLLMLLPQVQYVHYNFVARKGSGVASTKFIQ